MLRVGDLIDYPDAPGERLRILWLSSNNETAATILVDVDDALPELCPLQKVNDALEADRARLMLSDPYLPLVNESKVKEGHKIIRDARWKHIETLVNDVPAIFDPRRRSALVQALVAEAMTLNEKVTRVSVYLYLRRYWTRGMTPNALLPDYSKCGGKGKSKSASEKKRGRPRKYGSEPGANLTEEDRQIFRVAFSRRYASDKQRKWTLKDVYDYAIENFYCDKFVDENGRVVHVEKESTRKAGGLLTLRQFRFWNDSENNRLEIKRKRLGAKLYDKDLRGLIGTSTAEVMGPGSRYQIDATIADVYLVSRLDRTRIIGRPVLYVVIDVFSRMIVGIYVGLEGPSWVSAMMALANTVEDKVAFCKRHGINIETEDWPCHFLPAVFLGDRGEIEPDKINTLVNNFNVKVENASSYRADWKGIVEQRFRLLPAKFKKFVPGYIEPDFRARGGHDYRLDAVLDLEEFTQIIIECVLHYNNHHEIKRYDADRDVKADGVPSIPRELWEWGVRHRTGAMREFPQEIVRYSLMPRHIASVTAHGIYFRENYYTCPRAMEERWFDLARQEDRWKVEVAYDPRDFDTVYLGDAGDRLGFQVCNLTDRSRASRDLSLWEVDQLDQDEKHRKADRANKAPYANADLNAAIGKVVQGAIEKQGAPTKTSAAERTRDIRKNRAAEKEANREREAFRPGGTVAEVGPAKAKVIPMPTSRKPPANDYSLPSINEIRGEKDDDR